VGALRFAQRGRNGERPRSRNDGDHPVRREQASPSAPAHDERLGGRGLAEQDLLDSAEKAGAGLDVEALAAGQPVVANGAVGSERAG
jgi:hypothetical protein